MIVITFGQLLHWRSRQLEEMANAKPLLLPEVFGGDPQSWTEWLEHFESVAAINKWESAEEKMKWLKVRITGQARMAFRISFQLVYKLNMRSVLKHSSSVLNRTAKKSCIGQN